MMASNNFGTNRREFLKSLLVKSPMLAAAAASGVALNSISAQQAIAATITEDGLYSEPWFLETFLELQDDYDETVEKKKHFAIMWELKGCPYCKETHLVNFADKMVNQYVQDNFEILQLNFIGSRIVTDFDGEELSEKELARKYNVRYTPTMQFFPLNNPTLTAEKPKDREAIRFPGYMKPKHFKSMFEYVAVEEYAQQSFRSYLKNKV